MLNAPVCAHRIIFLEGDGALGEAKHKLFEGADLIKTLEDWELYLRSEPEVARWLRSNDDQHEPTSRLKQDGAVPLTFEGRSHEPFRPVFAASHTGRTRPA